MSEQQQQQQDLFAEFDPLFSSNTPATPADKKMNENDKILDAFGIKKDPVPATTTTTTTTSTSDNPFADFADLGVQSTPTTNTHPTPASGPALDLNLLMENNADTKNGLDSANFPVMSAEMLCPSVPNHGNNGTN